MFIFRCLLILPFIVCYTFAAFADINETTETLRPQKYQVPCNTKYPYGDEKDFNTDFLASDSNLVHCIDAIDLKALTGKCPPGDPNGTGGGRLVNPLRPYVFCQGEASEISPHDKVMGPVNENPNPHLQCQKCDLRLLSDKSAVYMDCCQCYDRPSTERPISEGARNVLYKVYFVQVSNYTSVDVTGKTNI